MRVFVELGQSLDAGAWAERHAAGEAADASPYGLGLLEEHGHLVRFSEPLHAPLLRRAGEAIAARTHDTEVIHGLTTSLDPARRTADVVLCMDERSGLAAALSPSRVPVVTGVAWLEDPPHLPVAYRMAATRGLHRAAGVFVECSAMLEPLREGFGVPEHRMHLIRLGIDAEHFVPTDAPPVRGRVFSVGDDRMRDYATLTDALERVRAVRPSVTAELATTLPVSLPRWATVHRRRMDSAVRECYHRAEVVALALHPTRHGSGLTVILETMASGRPLVVTANPGLEDYVVDGETGFLVPPGDSSAMAEAVGRLLDDPGLAERMGRAGRERVLSSFTTRHMISDLDGVLRTAAEWSPR